MKSLICLVCLYFSNFDRFSLLRKGIYLFVFPNFSFRGGNVLNLDNLKSELVSLKCELVARVKTINWRHPVLIVFIVLVALDLIVTVASARWGARWGGSASWGRWGGWGGSWGGSWGGWGRPWYGGWGGWW
jgi:hypothetical protein